MGGAHAGKDDRKRITHCAYNGGCPRNNLSGWQYKLMRKNRNPSTRLMADLVRNFVALVRVSELLPDTYEALRKFAAEGDLPTERTETGRIYLDRDFALRLVDCREESDTLTEALNKAFTSMSADTEDESISTTVSELAENFGVSERRMKVAATNTKGVERAGEFVETDERGLTNLREYLNGQVASG